MEKKTDWQKLNLSDSYDRRRLDYIIAEIRGWRFETINLAGVAYPVLLSPTKERFGIIEADIWEIDSTMPHLFKQWRQDLQSRHIPHYCSRMTDCLMLARELRNKATDDSLLDAMLTNDPLTIAVSWITYHEQQQAYRRG